MSDILVKPNQLQASAAQLKSSAKIIKQALSSTDHLLISLDPQVFAGMSAQDIHRIYKAVVERISIAPDKITYFAKFLEEAAKRFETADKALRKSIKDAPDEPVFGDDVVRSEFNRILNEKWQKMSVEERTKFLKDFLERFCKKFGIPEIAFYVSDLKDPEGKDSLGHYQNGNNNLLFKLFLGREGNRHIEVDLTNVNGTEGHTSPSDLLDTIVHEGRHAVQHYYIEHPDQRPASISQEQVNAWKDNNEHYISPEDDFEKYRDQPMEKDAREFAESYLVEYASNVDNYLLLNN